jgi:hypothetical protein
VWHCRSLAPHRVIVPSFTLTATIAIVVAAAEHGAGKLIAADDECLSVDDVPEIFDSRETRKLLTSLASRPLPGD